MTTPTAEERAELDRQYQALSPTKKLVMEVLACRLRLGHKLWTFTANQTIIKALLALEADGLVDTMFGVTENTIRASLTDLGCQMILDPDYIPPIFEKADLSGA